MSVRSNPSTISPLSLSGTLDVERSQLRPGQVEWNRDRHGLERNSPFRREIEAGAQAGEADPPQLLQELRQQWLEAGALDGEAKIADGGGPEVRLVEPGRLVGHGA